MKIFCILYFYCIIWYTNSPWSLVSDVCVKEDAENFTVSNLIILHFGYIAGYMLFFYWMEAVLKNHIDFSNNLQYKVGAYGYLPTRNNDNAIELLKGLLLNKPLQRRFKLGISETKQIWTDILRADKRKTASWEQRCSNEAVLLYKK